MSQSTLDLRELDRISSQTISHYDHSASGFWEGTKDHDVSQNIDALLRHIETPAPARILDLGCGPGRDLLTFQALGHSPTGLDGAENFCRMAREKTGCVVLHQDFLALDLPHREFDGIFANASLFHIPLQELPRVLAELGRALVPRGVLFSSNPRGQDVEGWNGDRYGSYHSLEVWQERVSEAGFSELEHYFRPTGLPREQQPWLASVWRVES